MGGLCGALVRDAMGAAISRGVLGEICGFEKQGITGVDLVGFGS